MPDFKAEIRKSIAGLNLPLEREAEIVEELSQDLEERFEKALSEGASEEEAKQLASEELVQPNSLGAQLKRVKMPLRRPSLAIGAKKTRQRFAGFWDDIRFGVRMLRKQPGFAFVAILTLGIGIGASTAMLSLVHDVLLRPLPYARSDRLYAIWASSESTGQTKAAASGPDFEDYLDQNRSFVHLVEYIPRFTFTWTGDGEPKLVTCTSVSQDFFRYRKRQRPTRATLNSDNSRAGAQRPTSKSLTAEASQGYRDLKTYFSILQVLRKEGVKIKLRNSDQSEFTIEN